MSTSEAAPGATRIRGISHPMESKPFGRPGWRYLTDRITDEAIRLIRSHDGEKPFS